MVGLTISGKLFDDANGLTDNVINGTGIKNPSSVQFYAYLLDPIDNVVSTAPVNTDGTFSLTRTKQCIHNQIKFFFI